jgi:hypothetical protein
MSNQNTVKTTIQKFLLSFKQGAGFNNADEPESEVPVRPSKRMRSNDECDVEVPENDQCNSTPPGPSFQKESGVS